MLLRKRFNITFDMGSSLGGLKNKVLPIYGKTKCAMKIENLSTSAYEAVHKYFYADFALYREAVRAFGVLLKGSLSPQLPDLCPRAKQCSGSGENCRYDGCSVPWLDRALLAQ